MGDTEFLAHHGVLNMKWGVRRYQNKDGSLTRAGQKKAKKMKDKYTKLTGKQLRRNPTKKSSTQKPKQKSISEMSDEEIRLVKNDIYDLAFEFEINTGIEFSPIIKNEDQYEYWIDTLPFYRNVRDEGVVIDE